MLAAVADMVWVKDPRGRYVEANDAFLKFVRRSRSEVIGATDADLFDAARAARGAELDGQALRSEHAIETGEELVDEIGDRRSLSTVRHPIPEVYGAAGRGIVGIVRDSTEREELERRLLQSQKMDAIGRLAGGIAHDFNNLLTAMTGYAELLLGELPREDPLRGNVVEIRTAIERATTLTRQLLAFSRRQLLEPRVLDLNDLIRNVGSMLKRLIGENIELAVPPPDQDVWPVLADPGQIEQIVVNLAVNARDAMPRGGRLRIDTANAKMGHGAGPGNAFLVEPGDYVQLSFTDTGVGMSPEIRGHLFEPFFTTKEKGKGTGLGLSMVYGIVKQSGGSIWVDSEPGRGTVFKIFLPRVRRAVEPVQAARGEKLETRGSETILLVEDEPEVRVLVEKLLKREGYRVLSATDPDAALRLVRGPDCPPIDLLLSDVVLPGMSGRELGSRLAAQVPNLRILYVSGYAEDGVVHGGVVDPGLAFLQKPFTPAALARKVRDVLEGPLPADP